MDQLEIQKFIEAKEIGRRSGDIIAGASGLNSLSDYKLGKEPGRQRIRSNSETSSQEKCSWCRKAVHGARAFKNKFDTCNKKGTTGRSAGKGMGKEATT